MPPSHLSLNHEEELFLSIGIEYYIAARSAAREGLISMVGILFHHAIEMCLKARLSHQYGLKKLSQKPFGHDLDALWHKFKAQFPQANLNRFDHTIQAVDAFWKIRYPDKIVAEGAQIFLDLHPYPGANRPASPPCYEIVVTDIDHLILEVFEICSRNFSAFVGGRNKYARDALEWNNPAYSG